MINFSLPPSGFRRLFYDIETSPNVGFFWKSGYGINIPPENIIREAAIMVICWKWEGQEQVHSATWDDDQNDRGMLEQFMPHAIAADEIIAHNGDRFDEKWIRTRCLMHGIPCPSKLNSYDTLKKARAHFRFNSNKLDYLGKLFFDEGKSPIGWQDWVDICLHRKNDALDEMVKYCKQDVVLLEDVFHKLQPYVEHNQHAGAFGGYGRYSCPSCGSDEVNHLRLRYTKAGTPKHQMRCMAKNCKRYFTISNKVYQQLRDAEFQEKMRETEQRKQDQDKQ
jgi:hypothetical protein